MKRPSVLLGISGGVDSAVAALLLKKGYDVAGVYLGMTEHYEAQAEEARKAAGELGIKCYVIDCRSQFKAQVIEPFIDAYLSGKTPNPCVLCNPAVKFKMLLETADGLGFDYIATGHYAGVKWLESSQRFVIQCGKDLKKDQSYFLYGLSPNVLSRLILPLSELSKQDVRELALNAGLSAGVKKDSQDICFISDDYSAFIQSNSKIAALPGNFVDVNGRILGQHKGIFCYTIGQRKGLGISAEKPYYVVGINVENNRVILGFEEMLFKKEVTVGNLNWLAMKTASSPIMADVKIRYSTQSYSAELIPENDHIRVIFQTPQRAPTPGQSAVFYKDNYVIGGGQILN